MGRQRWFSDERLPRSWGLGVIYDLISSPTQHYFIFIVFKNMSCATHVIFLMLSLGNKAYSLRSYL